MSHTDKDRPYWVAKSQDGRITDHRHLEFGKVYYRTVYEFDADDNPIMDEVEDWAPAHVIIHGGSWRDESGYYRSFFWDRTWRELMPEEKERVLRHARIALGSMDPNRRIVYGSHVRHRSHREVDYVMKDYCTEGEEVKRTGGHPWNAGRELPCTPDFASDQEYSYWKTWGRPGRAKFYARAAYKHEKIAVNKHLTTARKRYNTGTDIDDWDERSGLTNQHRHSMRWYW